MTVYELGRVPRILAGTDALVGLAAAFAALSRGGTGAVLVLDEAVAETGYAQRVAVALGNVRILRHIVAAGEPTVETVDAAAALVRTLPDAVVVGIGGGSTLDTAKQAAVVATGGAGVAAYLLGAHPFPGRRPIIAVPTTSGTGAEVTRTCILTDDLGRKTWTWGDEMLPDLVVLDPTAAATMPAHVTAATGLDAFVHAVEASSGQRRNHLSDAPAISALRLIARHLPAAVTNGADLAARQAMQEAALLAGTAIDNCGTGIAHAIGHALGSLYHLPHGVAVAIGLDAAIDWNVDGAAESYGAFEIAFSAPAHDAPRVLRELFHATAFASVVARLPPCEMDPAEIADVMGAVENRPMVVNNCRVADATERCELAGRTVVSWNRLRASGAAAAA